MRHKFKAIVQRAIVFAVQTISGLIGNIQNLFGIGGTFSAAVYLQLYAEETISLPIEDGIRFVKEIIYTLY